MYSLNVGESTHTYESRSKAVEAARDMSTALGTTLTVEQDNGEEALTYRNGHLESYERQTPGRPRN